MKTKAIIPLILGLGIGIVAIKLFVDKLQSAKASNKSPATVDVVTATTNINSTLEITESMLEVKQWPKNLVPEHTFQKIEDVTGRVTSSPIAKGGFIAETLLAPPGTPAGMASKLLPGYRAMAIKVDEVASVGGWIQPGSKVDVICVLRPSTRGADPQSRLLLQNVEVLAVGDKIQSNESGAQVSRSVSLMLTPKQVAKVELASQKGKLSLSMRNPEDETEQDVSVTENDLFGKDREGDGTLEDRIARARKLIGTYVGPDINNKTTDQQPVETVAAAPQEKPWTVEVISNNSIREIQFESDKHNARRVSEDAGARHRPSEISRDNGPRRPSVQNHPAPGAGNAATPAGVPGNAQPGSSAAGAPLDNTQQVAPSPQVGE